MGEITYSYTKIFLIPLLSIAAVLLGLGARTWKFSIPKQIDPSALREIVTTDSRLFTDPLSSDYLSVKNVSEKEPVPIFIHFDRSMTVGGLSVFFPGNMETDATYVPSDFDIYYKKIGFDWSLVDQRSDYGKSSYVLNLRQNQDLEGIKIVLLKSEHENGEVRMSDLKIFTKTNVGLGEYLFWLVSSNSKSLWSYLIYSFLFFLIIMIPGSGFLSLFTGEFFIFGPLASMFVLAISTVGFIISGNHILLYFYFPYFIAGAVLFFRRKVYQKIEKNKFLLFITITFLLATSLLQITRDTLLNLNYIEYFLDKLNRLPLSSYFGYHADNTMPWGIARSILHQVSPFSQEALYYRLGQPPASVTNRIPTLSLMVTPILSLFGEGHFIFQRFLNVLVSFYYLAVYWTVKQYFSERVSRLTTLIVLLSVPLSLITWNAELNIKYVSMFPLILATGFLAKNRHVKSWLVGFLLTFAVLVHPMAILFVPALVIVVWLARKSLGEKISHSIKLCLPPIIVLGLWFVITPLINGGLVASTEPSTSSNIYTYFNADSLTWAIKASNIINIFIPDYLNRFYPNFLTGEYARLFFRVSIIGAISPLFVFYLFFRSKIRTLTKYFSVIILSIVPQTLFWLHPHYYDFSSFSLFFPFAVPFLLALVIQDLVKDNPKRRIAYILSFIIFMGLSLYISSNAFPDLKFWDRSISIYSYLLWFIFIFISVIILKTQKRQ